MVRGMADPVITRPRRQPGQATAGRADLGGAASDQEPSVLATSVAARLLMAITGAEAWPEEPRGRARIVRQARATTHPDAYARLGEDGVRRIVERVTGVGCAVANPTLAGLWDLVAEASAIIEASYGSRGVRFGG